MQRVINYLFGFPSKTKADDFDALAQLITIMELDIDKQKQKEIHR